MADLPYEVSGWVWTEAFAGELAKSYSDFKATEHNVAHLVDILGQIISPNLAGAISRCRQGKATSESVRKMIQDRVGETDCDVSERVAWACTLLVGSVS